MLKAAVEICPEAMWNAGEHPRTIWRLAYHTLFYTHLYLGQAEANFQPWEKGKEDFENVYDGAHDVTPYSKEEILEYLALVDQMIDQQVDLLDLETLDCGFSWYTIPKLEHQLNNIRHIQEHTGQIRDRLFEAGFDLRWYGKAPE